MITVYHGSAVAVPTPEIIRGKFNKDFGTGFYCTLLREQAERWARRNSTAIVNTYDVVFREGLAIKNFGEMSDEWLDFVVACRRGVQHSYDIVSGAMADDQIYNYVDDFVSGAITREQFWVMVKFKHPTHQIAFCSQASLQCLSFRGSEAVHD